MRSDRRQLADLDSFISRAHYGDAAAEYSDLKAPSKRTPHGIGLKEAAWEALPRWGHSFSCPWKRKPTVFAAIAGPVRNKLPHADALEIGCDGTVELESIEVRATCSEGVLGLVGLTALTR